MSEQFAFKFIAIDSYSEKFSYYLAFFRFCGFLPIYPKTTFYTCLKNLFRIIYVFFIIISLSAFVVYIQTVLKDAKSLSILTLKSLFMVNLITTLTSFIQSDVSKSVSMNLLNKLDEIDRVLQKKLSVKIDYDKELRRTRNTIGLAILIFLIVSVVVLSLAFTTLKAFTPIFLRKIAGILIFVRCMQFLFFIQILHFRLLLVNNTIKALLSKKLNDSKKFNKIALFIKEAESQREVSLYDKLMILKNIHDSLWKSCQLVNELFGWSLLIIVSAFFIDFTLYGYFLILFFLRGNATITYGEIFGNACPKLIALLLICNAIRNCEKSVSINYIFSVIMIQTTSNSFQTFRFLCPFFYFLLYLLSFRQNI